VRVALATEGQRWPEPQRLTKALTRYCGMAEAIPFRNLSHLSRPDTKRKRLEALAAARLPPSRPGFGAQMGGSAHIPRRARFRNPGTQGASSEETESFRYPAQSKQTDLRPTELLPHESIPVGFMSLRRK
jgi:hypothetical protein